MHRLLTHKTQTSKLMVALKGNNVALATWFSVTSLG